MTNHTNKNLDFLSNEGLINILRAILDEIEITANYGAYKSTTYLAVSAIEGIFGELIKLKNLDHSKVVNWPTYNDLSRKGNPKSTKDLTLEERETVLQNASMLPKDFEKLYAPVRVFRNYMHPERELKNQIPIAQSIAQLSVACLNALIEMYEPYRFVARQEWQKLFGVAHVLDERTINLPQVGNEVSLITSNFSASNIKQVSFRVIVPRDAIFDILFNFQSKDNFIGARIEGREATPGKGLDNGRLICTKWHDWVISEGYTPTSEPNPAQREHLISIVLDVNSVFSITVDNTQLELLDGVGWEFDPTGKIGFMCEHGAISILDLQVLL